eukprot:scaffold22363_cov48-Phaeocystis_antarctica.AAC.2
MFVVWARAPQAAMEMLQCNGGVEAALNEPEPRSESGAALQRHDSWRSVRATTRCVRSADVGRARMTLRQSAPRAVEPARRSCS